MCHLDMLDHDMHWQQPQVPLNDLSPQSDGSLVISKQNSAENHRTRGGDQPAAWDTVPAPPPAESWAGFTLSNLAEGSGRQFPGLVAAGNFAFLDVSMDNTRSQVAQAELDLKALSKLLSTLSRGAEQVQQDQQQTIKMAIQASNDFLNVFDRLTPGHENMTERQLEPTCNNLPSHFDSSIPGVDRVTTVPDIELNASTTMLIVGCYFKIVPLLQTVCKMLLRGAAEKAQPIHMPRDAKSKRLPDFGFSCGNYRLQVLLIMQTML